MPGPALQGLIALVIYLVVFILAWFQRYPTPGEVPHADESKVVQSADSYSPTQVLVSPVFWVLYVMFVLVAAGGLMATAQLASIATYYDCVPGLKRELAAVGGDLDAFYRRVRELAKLDQEKRNALICGAR